MLQVKQDKLGATVTFILTSELTLSWHLQFFLSRTLIALPFCRNE